MHRLESPKLAFTIAEACHAVGIGRSKLYELIGQGRLETRKIGSRTLIPAESLRSLVAGDQ
ncbi:MAG: helix-turn-helix domain-containing protein [Sphingobium sp.]|nr:helix-turn-helix domain-containing protein [Sphingobium sp.]